MSDKHHKNRPTVHTKAKTEIRISTQVSLDPSNSEEVAEVWDQDQLSWSLQKQLGEEAPGRKTMRKKDPLGFPGENQLWKSPLSAVCFSGIWSERCGRASTFFTDSAGAGADRSRRSLICSRSFWGCSQRCRPDSTVSLQLLNKRKGAICSNVNHISVLEIGWWEMLSNKNFFFQQELTPKLLYIIQEVGYWAVLCLRLWS